MIFKRRQTDAEQRRNTSTERRPLFSYYARPELSKNVQTTVSVRQNRYAWWQQLPTYIAIVIFVFSALYVLSLDSNVKIAQFINPAEKQYLRDISVYQAAANEAFHSSILNRNKLTADTNQISRDLKTQFPELAEVAITLPLFGRKPILEVVPAKPVLLLNARNGAFALDKTGRALVNATDAPGLAVFTLPLVNDDAGIAVTVGGTALPEDNVTFILEVLGQLNAKELNVDTMTFPAIVNELHIKLDDTSYMIKLNTDGDAKQQIGTYFALREKLADDGVTPKAYVDVRVEEKAYYK